jgi:hypothetical protein
MGFVFSVDRWEIKERCKPNHVFTSVDHLGIPRARSKGTVGFDRWMRLTGSSLPYFLAWLRMSLDNKSGERRKGYDEISGDCKAYDTSTGEG